MVILPAARRHHRSRTLYAFGLLALLGAVTTLLVVVRHPGLSATDLGAPVPAPEITVVDEGPDPDPVRNDPTHLPTPAPAGAIDVPGPAGAGAGAGTDPLFEARRAPGGAADLRDDVSRSLFWTGILGLAISLAGLGLVGARRRRW